MCRSGDTRDEVSHVRAAYKGGQGNQTSASVAAGRVGATAGPAGPTGPLQASCPSGAEAEHSCR